MPILYIHALHANFDSRDEGADCDRPETALADGVQSAVGIVSDHIHGGQPSAAVHVCVEDADGTPVLRSVVTLSVAPLLVQAG